jgi:hypothetical protein
MAAIEKIKALEIVDYIPGDEFLSRMKKALGG